MTKKKKILFHSNHSKSFTGFGKNCKNVLRYLHSTGKYEIIEAANGYGKSNPILSKLPWKCVGTLPDNPSRMRQLQKDPGLAKAASYGSETIDSIVKEHKPDIYIGAEDIWAFNKYWDRKWWNKPTCMIWTTLDSQPILPLAVDAAEHITHYFSWASFAEREMEKLGHSHVKALRGIVEHSNFFRIDSEARDDLRKFYHIDSNCFLIGFVFRNQLRKSVPNLLDGFKILKEENPKKNIKLLLHTHWSEGWDIPRLIKEKGIKNLDVLTTYCCSECKRYEIKPYSGQEQDCKFCKSKKSQSTTNVQNGVSEKQLNEIYNLMDVYCHPFTSGGQEIPIQEAKLCELITLVTNYSCGEDHCTEESAGLPLEWNEYREPGTQFIKASTCPKSISEQLFKVLSMGDAEKKSMGGKARNFVIDNYSPEKVGAKLEEIIDKAPYCKWDFDFSEKERNPSYVPPDIKDDKEWLLNLYENILNMDVDPETDKGLEHWLGKISEGATRENILSYFLKIAEKENKLIFSKDSIENFIDDEGPEKRILVVMPESAGDVLMINALMPNLKTLYPKHNIYVGTKKQFFPLIEDSPFIHKAIPYSDSMGVNTALHFLEGAGEHEGFFDMAFLPFVGTQAFPNYLHNGKDTTQFNLKGALLKGVA